MFTRRFDAWITSALWSALSKDIRHGMPGKLREGQVWIAERIGDPTEKAIYIPQQPLHMRSLMDNLFDYINNGQENALIKAGIAHCQFEAIHPFDDGNGGIGRLLIPLILLHKQRLSSPILYLSGYFDDHRDEYIRKLHEIDEGQEMEQWLKFFLNSVEKQLNQTQIIIEAIYSLNNKIRLEHAGIKSPFIISFKDTLLAKSIITIKMVQDEIKCSSYLTATALIDKMKKVGCIKEIGNRERNKLIMFEPL